MLAGVVPVRRYAYIEHLKRLAGRRPLRLVAIPEECRTVVTPLEWRTWDGRLQDHPDQELRRYIVMGLKEGFRVGFQYGAVEYVSAQTNMLSATRNGQVVDEYLAKEVRLGRVAGPVDPTTHPGIQINRFGVIEKPHQPGKFRLIVDLSHPEGHSVNDGLEPELCTMRYTSVDVAVARVMAHGVGTSLAKFDIESAYRIVPVHPDDRPLLGMSWRGRVYVDKVLPFGLRSAPKIFSAVADAMQWIIEQQGVEMLHYLDDFLVISPSERGCERALAKALLGCQALGVPTARHKTEGPSTTMTFLGIELDTVAMTLRLPREKVCRLRREIDCWSRRRCCTKRELQSLIGMLQHASCVVRPGRTFLRRLIALLSVAKKPHHRIRLNRGFRSDLAWWATFLPAWNGTSMMKRVLKGGCDATVTSDASGNWGCGAFTSRGEWFQLEWPEVWREVHITVKELLPVVVALAIWGHRWNGKSVRFLCDNAAVVAIINKGTSKDERAMHLMRSAFFFLARHDVRVWVEHLPGVENGSADALSRNDSTTFLLQNPGAQPRPVTIPQELIRALILERPDWTSLSWTELLKACS